MKGSWKTTVAGIATALGMALVAVCERIESAPLWLYAVGVALTVFGPSLLGVMARDNDMSSEDVGVR